MDSYDIIVIGGGPAGIFAAGYAAQQGAHVLLLEKNRRCGAKLLITGKGRCNVTNSEADPRRLADCFGRQGKALLTALYAYGRDDVIRFFESRGLALHQERGGRIFPKQGGAIEVQRVLDRFLQETGATLQSDTVTTIATADTTGFKVTTPAAEYQARKLILATGGLSYPQTGSTGDGYRWAEQTGHKLVPPEPALVAIRLAEDWTASVCDFNLKNVAISACRPDGGKICERFGEAFFTRNGIGGPIILDMSAAIRDALKSGPVTLRLDLKPALDRDTFDKRLLRELAEHGNKDFANSLGGLLPKALIPLFIRLSAIDPGRKCHQVTAAERARLLTLFKELPLQVTGVGGFNKAIVTSGGVALADIDMRSMESKRLPGLYFAGEMIDLDGPTGGYNLQLCWSTGYLAGTSAATACLEG